MPYDEKGEWVADTRVSFNIAPPLIPHRDASSFPGNGFPLGVLRVTPRAGRLIAENTTAGGLEEFADLAFGRHNAVRFFAGKPLDGNWGQITEQERESNLKAIGGGKGKETPNSRGNVVSRHQLSKTGAMIHILTNFESGETSVHTAEDTDEPIEYLKPLKEIE